MLKKYKAIFFDWDGTAVMSRRAPVDQAVAAMRPLCRGRVEKSLSWIGARCVQLFL